MNKLPEIRKFDSKSKNVAPRIGRNALYVFFAAVFAFLFGIWMIVSQLDNKPIARTDAISYSGAFDRLESGHNYCGMYFQDQSYYSLFAHTQKTDFLNTIREIPKGTTLHILVNPNNGYVVEIVMGSDKLMDFEESQKDIQYYGYGYIALGAVACICGVFLVWFYFMEKQAKQRESQRQVRQTQIAPLRPADPDVKCRIFLEADVSEMHICYRRVRSTNELVINGYVYDEMKARVEFDHRLTAKVNGHSVAAGLKGERSYIELDGSRIISKRRFI